MREAAFQRAIADASYAAPHPRFAVYRNNVTSALINALRVRYPVVETLLGRQAFDAVTRDFVARQRPRSPVLIAYGDSYPEFIAANAPLPYLADVARLDNLWWRAYHAADAEPLTAQHFAVLTPENLETVRFGFHPSVAILASPWAIGAIWEAARQDGTLTEGEIARPQSILVWRPHADVRVRAIDDVVSPFLTALMDGKKLVDALGVGPGLDLQAQFQMLIASELITEIHL